MKHLRLAASIVSIAMIGVGCWLWLTGPIACVVVGGLVWIDLSIGSAKG